MIAITHRLVFFLFLLSISSFSAYAFLEDIFGGSGEAIEVYESHGGVFDFSGISPNVCEDFSAVPHDPLCRIGACTNCVIYPDDPCYTQICAESSTIVHRGETLDCTTPIASDEEENGISTYPTYCVPDCIQGDCWLDPDTDSYDYCATATGTDCQEFTEEYDGSPHTYYVYCGHVERTDNPAQCLFDDELAPIALTDASFFQQTFEYSTITPPVRQMILLNRNQMERLLNVPGIPSGSRYPRVNGLRLALRDLIGVSNAALPHDLPIPCIFSRCPDTPEVPALVSSAFTEFFPPVEIYDMSCFFFTSEFDQGKLSLKRGEITGSFPVYRCTGKTAWINPDDYRCSNKIDGENTDCIPSSREYIRARERTAHEICRYAGYAGSIGYRDRTRGKECYSWSFGTKCRSIPYADFTGSSWTNDDSKSFKQFRSGDSIHCSTTIDYVTSCFDFVKARRFSEDALNAYNAWS